MQRPELDSDGKLPERFYKTSPYGTFAYVAGNQASGGTTSENVIALDTEVTKNRLQHDNVTNNSQVTIVDPGIYIVEITVIVTPSANNTSAVLWMKKNGSNIANSAVGCIFPAASDDAHIHHAFTLSLASGDYMEAFWCSRDDASMVLTTHAAGASPTTPVQPCVVINITRISMA